MINFKRLVLHGSYDGCFGSSQKAVDNEVVRHLEYYTPIATERFKNRGKMSRSHKVESAGVVINTEPRARREYYINKGFSGPNRGKLWLERMKADCKSDILKKALGEFK